MATPYLDDFVGFTFNGTRSQDLHILRVSDGSRYSDTLTPNFQDTTAKMPGADGTLYWDSFYSERNFEVRIAFDSLSESDLRRLRQVFNAKAKGELIFDEAPYKAYNVKLQSPIQLTYICFDKNEGGRVYKGEGSIQFISYYPYARSVFKSLDSYSSNSYPNKDEWKLSSGMSTDLSGYDQMHSVAINTYNCGDIPADWIAVYQRGNFFRLNKIELTDESGVRYDDAIITFSSSKADMTNFPEDEYIRINSRTNLIEGLTSEMVPTGHLWNKYIEAGDFFKIPINVTVDSTGPSVGDEIIFKSYSAVESSAPCRELKYDYLYY